MDISDYGKILRNWQVEPGEPQEGIELPGSPDRTAFRTAITDTEGRYWVLEEIAEKTYSRKVAIAGTLETLQNRGLNILHPHERNTLGQFITCYAGRLCMLRPHIEGIPFNRETWQDEGWRADAMADFLIKLHYIAELEPLPNDGKPFSIIGFVKKQTEAFRRHRPEIGDGLGPVYQGLGKTLFPVLENKPTSFCHGNFLPLNVIWGKNSIRSVIDWEFCGIKPEAYDAALLVGCIGFDNPDALIDGFTVHFVSRLRDASLFAPESWDVFFDLIIAIRYGWLSEWMRTNDESARDLEMLYMNLLTTQKNYILGKWGLS